MTWLTRLLKEPFRIHGTDLPPHLLLIAKLTAIALTLKRYPLHLPDAFAPIVPFFEGLPEPYFRLTLQATFAIAAVALLLNQRVRACCVVLGTVFIIGTMSNRVFFHNGTFFAGVLLLMIGLQDRNKPVTLLPWQLGVMYFGCGLNKLFEADWRSGQYFAYYLPEVHGSDFYSTVAPWFPEGRFALLLCWTVIVQEVTAGLLFFVPRLRRMAVWIGAGVHAGAAMMVANDYGVFLYAVLISYLVVLPWPSRLVVRTARAGRSRLSGLIVALHRISHGSDPAVRYEPAPLGEFEIEVAGQTHRGFDGLWRLAVWTPVLYVTAIAAMTSLRYPWVTRSVRLTGFVASALLVIAAVVWLSKVWAGRPHQTRLGLAGSSHSAE